MLNENKVTKSAAGQPCIRCGNPHAWACHYNGPRQHSLGKGRGHKCNVLMTAEFCQRCDVIFTEGSTASKLKQEHGIEVFWETKYERSEEFLFWIAMTNIRREKNGVIK